MKGKKFSGAWDLATLSLFTFDYGCKQKKSKVLPSETNATLYRPRPPNLATHLVRIGSNSFVFTFLPSTLILPSSLDKMIYPPKDLP